jgi:hypothetical protein
MLRPYNGAGEGRAEARPYKDKRIEGIGHFV